MRFFLAFILTFLLSFIAGLYLPWWSIALVAFLVALLLPQSAGRSFGAGFAAVFLLWGLLALWRDLPNKSLLSQKIAQLFYLQGSSLLLILVTALVGGIVAGFAAMSGSTIRPYRKSRVKMKPETAVAS